MRYRLLQFCSMCLCLTFLTGCADKKDVAPVSGKVTLGGKPVPNASVAFYPSEQGSPSVGTTREDGTFELKITGTQNLIGAKIGNHKVTVSAFKEIKPKGAKPVDSGLGSIGMDSLPPVKRKPLLPVKYASMRTTDLTFEVKADEENVANFDL